MPVSADTPEPLKSALEHMEASVQSTKQSLAFAAPEMFDTFYAELQMAIAGAMYTLAEEVILDCMDKLEGKGYRDPTGRPAEVHLAIEWFKATEPDDEPAQSLDDLENFTRPERED